MSETVALVIWAACMLGIAWLFWHDRHTKRIGRGVIRIYDALRDVVRHGRQG
jgi:hypothetical protein